MDSPCAFMNKIIRFMITADHDLTHEYVELYYICDSSSYVAVVSFIILVIN